MEDKENRSKLGVQNHARSSAGRGMNISSEHSQQKESVAEIMPKSRPAPSCGDWSKTKGREDHVYYKNSERMWIRFPTVPKCTWPGKAPILVHKPSPTSKVKKPMG